MEGLYIYHKRFGKCKVLAFCKDIAIIKVENNYEKFVVTIGLSKTTNSWTRGFYHKNYKDAISTYRNLLDRFYKIVV